MIVNGAATQAISSLKWVHKGSLWVYEIGSSAPKIVELSDAKYLTIKTGKDDFFSVVHNWDGEKLEISAHNHSDPHRAISSISLRRENVFSDKAEFTIKGDFSVWQKLPRAYTASVFGDYHLFLVEQDGSVSIQALGWFASRYDKMYQSIVGVEELPDSHLLIVSIQRDSNPVLYDPDTGMEVRKLSLAGRHGNPQFCTRNSAHELWANDYDHIVKLDAKSLIVKATEQLQYATTGCRQYIGEFSLDRSESHCLVARPFSGDVIVLDCDTLRQTHRAAIGNQPIEAALLGYDFIVALNWPTGEFLQGKLERI